MMVLSNMVNRFLYLFAYSPKKRCIKIPKTTGSKIFNNRSRKIFPKSNAWVISLDANLVFVYSDMFILGNSFVSNLDTNATYFISLIQPANPKVGENDFEILINRKASMIDWPYEPYLTVEFEPYMPAMNHGSPNNVNPSHIGAGHYKGLVNFTMTGWWQLNMVIKDGEGSILNDDSYFDVTFQ